VTRVSSIIAFGALSGAVGGALLFEPPLLGAGLIALCTALDFTAVALLVGAPESFLPGTRIGRALERWPFLAAFALKTVIYGAIVGWLAVTRFGANVLGLFLPQELEHDLRRQIDAKFPVGLLLPMGLIVTAFFILLHHLRMLIGERTLRDVVLGRYHRARSEERFFLFIDVAGSTPLAERIGPAAVHDFLNRIFQLASDPIDAHGGEVYQYVGDEMVVTWKAEEGRSRARPLACYFAVERALAREAEDFAREFGVVPRLRAALHAGTVITGEVGGSRRAIVFHGDVMNTASRIENATRELQRSFLASEDALRRMDGKDAYTLVDLGPQALRGREAPVRLFEVRA
jgi:adenylate cyclase